MTPLRLVFFGTPEFSVPFLNALAADPKLRVVAAVSQPDRPSGRHHTIVPTPIRLAALAAGIEVFQPAKLRSEEAVAALRAYGADAFVVVAYGKLIPDSILQLPRLGCINVHPSLLPKLRGPSPMQWAVAQGDAMTGITIMLLDRGMDTGPILSSVTIGLDSDETYETLVAKVHEQGPRLLIETLQRHANGEISPVPQDNEHATVTRLLEREDGHVNWNLPMATVERMSRAYRPWPGIWSVWKRDGEETRLKFLDTSPTDFNADLPPGTVSRKQARLFVDCLDGTLEIHNVQPEGKPPMTAEAFLRGYSDIDGAVLA